MHPVAYPAVPLRDDLVELRPPAPPDRGEVVAICQDPEIPRWTRVPLGYTPAHFDDFVRIANEGAQAGTDHPFLIHARDDDRVVGACGVHVIDERDLVAEIGYWARAEDRGNGFVTAGVRLLLDWVWSATAWERIEIRMAVPNHASVKVAQKVGAHLDATIPNRVQLPDGRFPIHVFGLHRPT